MPPTFCGNPPAPAGKVIGTPYECLRKGVGVGKYLLPPAAATAVNRRRWNVPWYIYIIITMLFILIIIMIVYFFIK